MSVEGGPVEGALKDNADERGEGIELSSMSLQTSFMGASIFYIWEGGDRKMLAGCR